MREHGPRASIIGQPNKLDLAYDAARAKLGEI